jgi:hypothetical protein
VTNRQTGREHVNDTTPSDSLADHTPMMQWCYSIDFFEKIFTALGNLYRNLHQQTSFLRNFMDYR